MELLNNHYTPEQCRLMFPTQSIPAGTRKMAVDLASLLDCVKASSAKDRPPRVALLNDCLQQLADNRNGAKGLRLDVQVITERGRELIIDVGTTHHTQGKPP